MHVVTPSPLFLSVFLSQDDMEQLWEAAIGAKLGLDSKHHPIVLIESPMIVKADREALLKILFESLGAPAVYLASSAVMALYANNMTTGLVVSCGGVRWLLRACAVCVKGANTADTCMYSCVSVSLHTCYDLWVFLFMCLRIRFV